MQNIQVQGTSVPALGFGTAGLTGDACVEGVRHAIELGYRQIDTARMYANENRPMHAGQASHRFYRTVSPSEFRNQ